MEIAAVGALIFAVMSVGVGAFQIALALGVPWGAYAMGGTMPGRFSAPLRVAALVQAAVIGLLAMSVLSAGGLVLPELAAAIPWLAWPAVAFSSVAVFLNLISRSAPERRIWVPVAGVMLASSLVIALAA